MSRSELLQHLQQCAYYETNCIAVTAESYSLNCAVLCHVDLDMLGTLCQGAVRVDMPKVTVVPSIVQFWVKLIWTCPVLCAMWLYELTCPMGPLLVSISKT